MRCSLARRVRRILLVAAIVAWPGALPAAETDADSSQVSVSAEVDVVSRYVWRTLTYSQGSVVQPSVTLTLGAAELGLWANLDPALPVADRLNEVDGSAAWTLELGSFELTPTLMLYTYPGLADANTGELQLELRRPLPGGFAAFGRHSIDVLDYPGAAFTSVGLEREWSFPSSGALSVTAQVGRGSERFGGAYLAGGLALSVVGLGASWTVPIGRGWALRPHVDWLEVVESEVRAALPAHTPLAFGIAFGRP